MIPYLIIVIRHRNRALPWESHYLDFIIPAPRVLLQHLIVHVALAILGRKHFARTASACLRKAPYQYPYSPGQYHVYALLCAVNIQMYKPGGSGTRIEMEYSNHGQQASLQNYWPWTWSWSRPCSPGQISRVLPIVHTTGFSEVYSVAKSNTKTSPNVDLYGHLTHHDILNDCVLIL